MAYCKSCGEQIEDEDNACRFCGCIQNGSVALNARSDGQDNGIEIISFLIPIIGLVLYCIWQADTPLKAHSALKGAVVGIVVYVAVILLFSMI